MICKHCKTENENGALFCSNCGKPLNDEDQQAASGNTRLYIGVSIALMIFLAGGLVFGFFYFSNKVQKANEERNAIASESDVAASYFRSQIREQEDAIEKLKSQIDSLEATVSDYQEQIADYEAEIANMKKQKEAMDGLASFTDAVPSQGFEDMFVSDTVLKLTEEDAVVRVCLTGQIEVSAESENEEIASCTWETAPNGPSVARLRVTPHESGTTVLTIKNNLNEEALHIYVYVE